MKYRLGYLVCTALTLVTFDQARAGSREVDALTSELMKAPVTGLMKHNYSVDVIKKSFDIRRGFPAIDISSIRFRTDSAKIDPSEQSKLDDIANALKEIIAKNPREVFLLEGHTDKPGSRRYNQSLSERRAKSVRKNLIENYGIAAANLESAGYGEAYVKVPGRGPKLKNRRVTFRRITDALPVVAKAEPMPAKEKPAEKKAEPAPVAKAKVAAPKPEKIAEPAPAAKPVVKMAEKIAEPAPVAKPAEKVTVKKAEPAPAAKPVEKAKVAEAKMKPEAPKPFEPTLKKQAKLPFTPPEPEAFTPPVGGAVAKPVVAGPKPAKPVVADAAPKPKAFEPTLNKVAKLPFTPPKQEVFTPPTDGAVAKTVVAAPKPAKPVMADAAPKPKAFEPTLKKVAKLPFTLPKQEVFTPPVGGAVARPVVAAPKPAAPVVADAAPKPKAFVPTLKKVAKLPFTPPKQEVFTPPVGGAVARPVVAAPAKPVVVDAAPKPKAFVPTLKKVAKLPFTPPEQGAFTPPGSGASKPAATSQPAKPAMEARAVLPKAFVPTLKPATMLPFVPQQHARLPFVQPYGPYGAPFARPAPTMLVATPQGPKVVRFVPTPRGPAFLPFAPGAPGGPGALPFNPSNNAVGFMNPARAQRMVIATPQGPRMVTIVPGQYLMPAGRIAYPTMRPMRPMRPAMHGYRFGPPPFVPNMQRPGRLPFAPARLHYGQLPFGAGGPPPFIAATE